MVAPTGPYTPGTRIGGCVLDRLVGIGGMSYVYAATDERQGLTVAVKVPKPEANIVRFEIEGEIGSVLNDPSVVRTFRRGMHHDGVPYIVMEFVPFPPLSVWLSRQGAIRFDDASIARVGLGVAHALDYAYSASGIAAHRDVKPGNVFVDFGPSGANQPVKLGDFGVVKKMDTNLTGHMQLIGVAQYLAPEVVTKQEYSMFSDMYALGILMYLMAAGRTPFDGDNAVQVAMRHVRELPPPLRRFSPAISKATEEIIMRCIEKMPASRFASMSELTQVLGNAAGAVPSKIVLASPSAVAVETAFVVEDFTPRNSPGAIPVNPDKENFLWRNEQTAPGGRPSSFGVGIMAGGAVLAFLSLLGVVVGAVLPLDVLSKILIVCVAVLVMVVGLTLIVFGLRDMLNQNVEGQLAELDFARLGEK